jgi:hypothetical protein
MRRMSIARWTTKATNTRLECVIFIAFPLQQRLCERTSVLRYTHTDCLGSVSNSNATQNVLYHHNDRYRNTICVTTHSSRSYAGWFSFSSAMFLSGVKLEVLFFCCFRSHRGGDED